MAVGLSPLHYAPHFLAARRARSSEGLFRSRPETSIKLSHLSPKIQSDMRPACLDHLTIPCPKLFVCLCGSRPSSSKHGPATSRPISVPLAVNSRLYIYSITLMLPANSDDTIRQPAGEKRFCLSLADPPLEPPAHSFPTIDAGALH